MRFAVEYPLGSPGASDDVIEPANVAAFAQTAERVGFDAVGFTEHPAPSEKWLRSGGHGAFDPFAALCFCAGVTERIRLLTYIAVLPYRNPFLTAKLGATVDVLSNGRLIIGCGTGYLRSEFAALGVDFDERNALTDEALEAIKGIWTTDNFSYEGRHFVAPGQTATPKPVQSPHPPFWFGGNATASLRRIAREGQGWAPLLMPNAEFAKTTRTRPLVTLDDLRARLGDLHELVRAEGRDPAELDVATFVPSARAESGSVSAEQQRAEIGELTEAGVTWALVRADSTSAAASRESLERYGEEIIAKVR